MSQRPPNSPRRAILGAHLILTGYGHWLSNDLRGSGSTELRKPALGVLGPIHFGRKKVQPPRHQIKAFYREAEPLLDHPTLWFDQRARETIAAAIARAAESHGYTIWAFAACSNHAHLVVRTHRDRAELPPRTRPP